MKPHWHNIAADEINDLIHDNRRRQAYFDSGASGGGYRPSGVYPEDIAAIIAKHDPVTKLLPTTAPFRSG